MEPIDSGMFQSAKKGKSRAGKKDLIKHLTGQRITRSQAIKAKCYDCLGMGEVSVCDMPYCALWPYSPYGGGQHRGLRRKSLGVALEAITA